jgi:hypothetical protein
VGDFPKTKKTANQFMRQSLQNPKKIPKALSMASIPNGRFSFTNSITDLKVVTSHNPSEAMIKRKSSSEFKFK